MDKKGGSTAAQASQVIYFKKVPLADPPIYPMSEAQVIIKMMIASRVKPLPFTFLLPSIFSLSFCSI